MAPTCAAFNSDRTLLAFGDYSFPNTIKLWSMPSAQLIGALDGSVNGVEYLKFSDDGKRLAVRRGGHKIELWDMQDKKRLNGCNLWFVRSVLFSPCGNYVLLATEKGGVEKRDVANPDVCIHLLDDSEKRHGVDVMALSHDATLLAVASSKPGSPIPVSYTHLDVYKRQGVYIVTFNIQNHVP